MTVTVIFETHATSEDNVARRSAKTRRHPPDCSASGMSQIVAMVRLRPRASCRVV
jgi:hypothetical protein